jgi:hypothetical protein
MFGTVMVGETSLIPQYLENYLPVKVKVHILRA